MIAALYVRAEAADVQSWAEQAGATVSDVIRAALFATRRPGERPGLAAWVRGGGGE